MPSLMPTITLSSGDELPGLGQGTWHLAEIPARRPSEIAALRRGLDIGMNMIGTAEMYADGGAEILVGEAIAGRQPVAARHRCPPRRLSGPDRPGLVLRLDGGCAIPRSSRPEHVYENHAALEIRLDRDELAALDQEFPPPLHPRPLEML